jgi:hypothetical protein
VEEAGVVVMAAVPVEALEAVPAEDRVEVQEAD